MTYQPTLRTKFWEKLMLNKLVYKQEQWQSNNRHRHHVTYVYVPYCNFRKHFAKSLIKASLKYDIVRCLKLSIFLF